MRPAEEDEGGARLMVEEGVMERYPVEAVYGMHNWPGLPAGQFAIRPGPMMAAFDIFEIAVEGRGAHAAMPHHGIDPVVAAAQIVNGLQTIASRNIHPLQGSPGCRSFMRRSPFGTAPWPNWARAFASGTSTGSGARSRSRN